MIGLAAQTVCASAASATCNCWNPQMDLGLHTQTHTQPAGGHTLTQLGRVRMTEPRAPCHIPCSSRGPGPGMPLELVLFMPWPFSSCIHLVVPWVVLAPQHTGCGTACAFGSPAPPVPRLSVPLSAAPGHLHPPHGDGGLIGAEGGHGGFKCPVLFVANPLPPHPPQAYATTWHLHPPAGSRAPLAGGTVPAWQMGMRVSCRGTSARIQTGLHFWRAGHSLLYSSP